jgi:hypothetical protein
MMYSTEPLISSADTHFGFFVCVSVVLFVVFATFIANWLEVSLYHAIETAFRILMLLGFSFLLPIGLVSWNSGTEYTNIPITATLVATSETETLEYHYKRGDIYINSRFVTYLTPDGEVVFKRKEGVVYPRKAILYKN